LLVRDSSVHVLTGWRTHGNRVFQRHPEYQLQTRARRLGAERAMLAVVPVGASAAHAISTIAVMTFGRVNNCLCRPACQFS
jgi:hypothetical protein